MRVSKIAKKLLVMLLIVAIILPCSAEVLATAEDAFNFEEEPIIVEQNVEETEEVEPEAEEVAIEDEVQEELEAQENAEEELTGKLTHEMQSAKIETAMEREGGDESSGTINSDKYDDSPYAYQVANSGGSGRKTVFKLIQEKDYSYEDALYCVNSEKSFPSAHAYDYKNMGDVKTETTTAAASLINSIGAKNYKSLIWLIDNMYLPKQQPGEKVDYIKKAFAEELNKNVIPPVTVESIMETITDDDIEVVQQWAIWYFTNGNTDGLSADYLKYYHARYSTFGSVYIKSAMLTNDQWQSLSDRTGNGARQEFMNILYAYLVDNAKKAATTTKTTYPSFGMQNTDIKCTVDGEYYKVGPFKVNSGAGTATIKLVDNTGNEIERSKYQIKIDGENSFTNKNVNNIFNSNYYIYLPIEGNTITKVKMTIDYKVFETDASLWTPSSDDTLQPIVLITRGEKPRSDSREKDIETKQFDLALRKYIIKAGNTNISNRIPEVNPGTIASTGTAEYKHRKEPVSVKAGDTVVYEIRVYNERGLDGTATKITDYLPAGMTLAENSNVNKVYGWTASEDGRVATTEYLKDSVISAYSGSGDLDSLYVQIECKIADDLANDITENVILTNVAEITGYSRKDEDSEPSVDPSTIDTKNYSGHKDNKEELNDSECYYKGLQDDDDFEKVVIEPNQSVFDLALRKFITKINGKTPNTSREPKVDVSKLKDGSSTNATYTHPKTTLEVQKGDIVTYTIRVYNEGDIDGYAEEISDYIPAGLGYLKDYTKNIENKWSIPSDAKTTKLSQIENGTSNVKKEDFTGNTSLGDQVVVLGGGKFVSTALASSNSSNVIKAFDKNGNTLSYKDVEITCIVLADSIENNNLRNIAEIKKDSNPEGKGDRDSTPDTVDPSNYPNGEGSQDDHDFENLTLPAEKRFDLSLQKFITGLNNNKVDGREPTITKNNNGTFRYSHTTDPLKVANKDLVTYTIRVYNEGDIDGYAKEVMDDIPAGLKYLPDNNVNKEYEWKMYDKNGKETTDVNQAASIKTAYLSRDNEKNGRSNLIEAYNDSKQTPSYRDVQVVFEVVETALPNKTERTIINTAEITDDEDRDGNPVEDKDSTPGNNKSGEDDIDQERVSVKYFDLALKKSLSKIIITENGKTREINAKNEDDLLKVEINRKFIDKTTVKFVYNITVTNQGEIAGYAKELKDHIPTGLKFVKEDNKDWTEVSKDIVKTEALANTLLEPGKSASVSITLEWENSENNLGQKVNIAEISKDYNDVNSPDIDSTPDNFKDGEDDQDDAPVILSISTGEEPVYIVLSTTVMAILVTGIVLIKKYVLI